METLASPLFWVGLALVVLVVELLVGGSGLSLVVGVGALIAGGLLYVLAEEATAREVGRVFMLAAAASSLFSLLVAGTLRLLVGRSRRGKDPNEYAADVGVEKGEDGLQVEPTGYQDVLEGYQRRLEP